MDRPLILASFFTALGQISDPAFRSVLAKGVGLTFLLLAGLYALVFYGTMWLVPDAVSLPWVGEITFADTLLSWGSLVLMIILSVFLMVPVASAFTGIFLDEVADAVEARHYPHLQAAPHVSLVETLRESLIFLAIIIAANLFALLFYFTPLAPFIFFGVNGFLLGREYFRMIAIRRLGRPEVSQVFRRHFLTIWAAGALMVMPLTIPIVNLVIPILGAATFTHIYHRIAKTA